VSKKSITDTI